MSTAGSGRTHYTQQLQDVRDEILMMGSMVSQAIEGAVEALKKRDPQQAREVVAADQVIDAKQYELEERTLTIIATQQPMAGDLRSLAASLFIVGELERMGDYAEGIAKIAIMVSEHPPLKPLIDIPRMAEISVSMLQRSLTAYMELDLEECRKIWHTDDEVDGLYVQVYRELLTYMLQDPGSIERATYYLWCAHNLERIADRVTNVCERTAYVITGDPQTLPGRVDPD
ncbi:MAG: phosphate transport system regulatory protein PhoU [Sphaerobacteraceae bacterium]|nr:MAG: phosphate transport system regulatory protein PhoU [Sphaerobacteraceae bacterium]